MLEYFKNIANNNSCSTGAVCSIHPSVQSLFEIILREIAQTSFYAVKLKEYGYENKSAYDFLVEILSVFMINASFNHKKYFSLVLKLDSLRKSAKDKYLDYCKNSNIPYETIDNNFEISENTTLSELIEYSEKCNLTKNKVLNREKQRLFELVTLMVRLSSINVVKIKKLEYDDSYDFEILKFFSVTNNYSISKDKIKKRILEFSSLALKIKRQLYELQKKKFNQKETTLVNLSLDEGYNILVSGDDFDELDRVLNAVENYENNEEINVYTNGSLFLANLYPYFKNNKFLKGHFGSENSEFDFSNFNGSILITQNFVQKIDSLYRGEIFSKKLISFTKVCDIENNDYLPLIKACFNFNKTEKTEDKKVLINYDKNKLNNLDNRETVFIIGRLNNEIQKNKNYNKNIVFLNSAIEGEILLDNIDILKEKSTKITAFFSECNLSNLDLMFILLNQDFKFYFVNCSNTLINPYVTEALKEDFNVKII